MKHLYKLILPLFVLALLAGCKAATQATDQEASSSSSSSEEGMMDDQNMTEHMYAGVSDIDMEHSSITFIGKSNIINHEGAFSKFTIAVTPDATTPDAFEKASVHVTIDVDSIDAGAGVTDHLKKEEFFDVATYPEATFTSTSIAKKADGTYAITGDLSVKGTTKSVVLTATVTDAAIDVTYDFPRKEFGIGNDSYGNKLLEEYVPVEAHVALSGKAMMDEKMMEDDAMMKQEEKNP